MAELNEHWRRQQEQRLRLALGRAGGDDLVFATWDGSTRSPNGTTKEWTRALAEFRLPRVTLHALHHTHVSQIIAAGMDPVAVSRRLGYAAVSITFGVYGHLFENSGDRAADIIEEAFGKTLSE